MNDVALAVRPRRTKESGSFGGDAVTYTDFLSGSRAGVWRRALSCSLWLTLGLSVPAFSAAAVPEELLEGLEYRSIGPTRGGRVTAVAGHVDHPFTFYMGSTGGGVWRTTNAGQSWHNITDGFLRVGSVGAVTVAPSDSNVIYVGTGSASPRGNVSVGDGVYRSRDAGKTWKHIGLDDAGLIGRIHVHPDDPNRLWVAVLGQIFGQNEERGVFRSNDGGDTWEKVLYVSERAGAVDLSLDPLNPRVLFAAIWVVERKPWTIIDGGEESGLYRSINGGDSWEKLSGGLPDGVLGRIGVSVSPARKGRVFALVTADEDRGGLYRSDDGGDSWTRTSRDRNLQQRGWYYSHVTADPANGDTVWVNNVRFHRSIDGGKTFERVSTPHGDNHDLWVNPEQPHIMVQGNDGGANVSLDGGRSWSSQNNQPTAEFYRVTTDQQFPYRVYGAQQDNTTISVSSDRSATLTQTQDWYDVAGAESGHIAVDPTNPDIVYSGNYLGRIDRYDHATGYSRNVLLYPQMQDGTAPRDLKYRFQWNAPILISRHDHELVYHASNYVHRTSDGGMTWQTISPDLTRNDAEKQGLPGGTVQYDHTGVEVYNTIFALAESAHARDELWAGADDGLLFLSTDGAVSWEDVTPKEMPLDATINSIDVSEHVDGTVTVAAHRYRMDDFAPYVFRTNDRGKSWERLVSGFPERFPVRVVREDPEVAGLLYAGGEFGMYWSVNGGGEWHALQLNLPRTPITDLIVHGEDLVVSTQGRSFWILDDLPYLRQVAQRTAVPSDDVLFQPGRAMRVEQWPFSGGGVQAAPRGAGFDFWLQASDSTEPAGGSKAQGQGGETDEESSLVPGTVDEDVEIRITSADGRVIRTWRTSLSAEQQRDPHYASLEVSPGLNRLRWGLRGAAPRLVDGAVMSLAYTGGPFVPPGNYSVTLQRGNSEPLTQSFEVVRDPRLEGEVSDEDLVEQDRLVRQVRDALTAIHDRIRQMREVRSDTERLLGRLSRSQIDAASAERVRGLGQGLVEAIDEAEPTLIQTKNEVGQDPINFPPQIDDQFAYLYSHVVAALGRPTPGSYERLDDLRGELAPKMEVVDEILGGRLASFNEALTAAGLGTVTLLDPIGTTLD